ncbi:hypothetical protein QTG54_004873 [Skeletonema marinoi]|uniref:MYND-type domain-containing protein n=1 Tax=Skeletonema marinoi TaxID=267567 RepID=A0AAD8YF73_9STRA|nr:hypothetical protein QTG54_004873 [Skeletonema marinoi]
MVSRKKAKGKARKAAAKAKAGEEFAAFKPFSLTQFKKSSCTHGWIHDEYADNHDCHKFIESVLEAFGRTKSISDIFDTAEKAALQHKYPEIWKDPAKLEWIASAFVSIGVEAIIREGDKYLYAYSVAYSEWIHQYVACELHKSVPAVYSARLNELIYADKRRIISYLKKRIPCSCLNSSYNVVKHLPKKGLCCFSGCSHIKIELGRMWSCEGCRREHYCSETCQAANWLHHREGCKVWREWEATED